MIKSEDHPFGSIRIVYFASLAEQLGIREERILLPKPELNIQALKNYLIQRIGPWRALEQATIRSAVNQQLADNQHLISNGDEVAFFPPVTGG